MPEHGGRLLAAARRYGIPAGDWLDLSTGINPNGWPVQAPPAVAWARLPEDDDGLEDAARACYGTRHLLPVAGSQAAIQALPMLRAASRPGSRVAVPAPAYAEHAHAWRRAGHAVVPVAAGDITRALPDIDVLVLVNPNNPTGARVTPGRLLDWHARLAARGGWLVVDEAFVDTIPELSLAPACPRPGLFVLRSLGKFFGLAGARLGFVLAEPGALHRLAEHLGPWTVAAPTRWVATRALSDAEWQRRARRELTDAGERLRTLLADHHLAPAGGCALFQWVKTPRAAALHERLARGGILVRRFDDPVSLRLGLPGTEAAWVRLREALAGTPPI